jgi:hypothetical protein
MRSYTVLKGNKEISNKAYHTGGISVGASAVRRYSGYRINTGRPFLAEAHLDFTLAVIKFFLKRRRIVEASAGNVVRESGCTLFFPTI